MAKDLTPSHVLIADSFLATLLGSVQLARLSEQRPIDVLVVRTTDKSESTKLVIDWLQSELTSQGSSFRVILLSRKWDFNPFKLRGIGWRRALRPLHERRQREQEFKSFVAQIASIPHSQAAETVWYGASPINSYLEDLFPRATRVRIDHGLSDTFTDGAATQPNGVRRALLHLEKLALKYPYQQPIYDKTLSLLSDEVLDFRSRQLTHRALIHTSTSLMGAEQVKRLQNDFALLLVPTIIEARQQPHTLRLAGHFADAIKNTTCPSLILLKGHPTCSELSQPGSQENLALQVECILRNRGISHVRVMCLDPQLPTELFLPYKFKLLVGPLSTSHLTTRLWSQTTRVVEIDWRRESKETALEWRPDRSRTTPEASLSAFDDFRSSLGENRIRRSFLRMVSSAFALYAPAIPATMQSYPELDWERLPDCST